MHLSGAKCFKLLCWEITPKGKNETGLKKKRKKKSGFLLMINLDKKANNKSKSQLSVDLSVNVFIFSSAK